MTYVLQVTGDREWNDRVRMVRILKRYPAGTWLIHGDARGADRMAGEIGKDFGFVVVAIPYISSLGRAGGPVRNLRMLDVFEALLKNLPAEGHVIYFHDKLSESKGTKNMVDAARRRNLLVKKCKAPA